MKPALRSPAPLNVQERNFKEAVAEHNAAVARDAQSHCNEFRSEPRRRGGKCVAIEAAREKAFCAAPPSLRAGHGAKVAAALKPAREAAAARILELLSDFAEIGVLTEPDVWPFEQFEVVRLPPLGLDDAEKVARRIAGSAAQRIGRALQNPKKKPPLTDRLIGLIEGLSADDDCADEELEFVEHRISALEDRLARLDGAVERRPRRGERGFKNLIDGRRAAGLKAKSLGVTMEASARKRSKPFVYLHGYGRDVHREKA